jgi:N-acetyl-gamma-glutamylphosphate reductase
MSSPLIKILYNTEESKITVDDFKKLIKKISSFYDDCEMVQVLVNDELPKVKSIEFWKTSIVINAVDEKSHSVRVELMW